MKQLNFLHRLQSWLTNAVDIARYEQYVNGDFLGRVRAASRFKKITRDAKRNPQKYVFATGIAVLVFYVVFGDYGVIQRVRQEAIHRKLQHALHDEQRRIVEFETNIEKAKQLDEIERLAREKYNLSLKDEIIYKVKER